jgi:hypothetical protein
VQKRARQSSEPPIISRTSIDDKRRSIPPPSAAVTTTKERVERMLTALNAITEGRGSNMFLFADQAGLAASNAAQLGAVQVPQLIVSFGVLKEVIE